MNLRPFGPEPNALPDCATPRSGADKGTRTLDLLITNQPLYQLSYIGTAAGKNLPATIIITEARRKVNPFLDAQKRFWRQTRYRHGTAHEKRRRSVWPVRADESGTDMEQRTKNAAWGTRLRSLWDEESAKKSAAASAGYSSWLAAGQRPCAPQPF